MIRVALLASLLAAISIPTPVESDTAPPPSANGNGATTFVAALKGKSETFDGQKFPYTGVGTLTIDEATGALSYSFDLSNGLTFAGTGTAAITSKGRIFGIVDTSSGGIMGSVIIEGKTDANRQKFSVKMTAAIPNRLGPPPGGFVLSKIKAKGVRL
ncbi:MAG: hypothetical protein H6834_04810 [Planctomycetes bacterium]|nr:hypothetical protein [Planctomycetota bacterium]